MIDLDKIDLLVKEGEGLHVEFKERFTPRIDEDMVAFANTKGGCILLGVRDNRTIAGEQLTNDLKAKINSVARNCNPSISVTIREAGKVIAIEVPQGDEKPYYCSSGYYRRLDGATQKMSNQELRVMFQELDTVPFEEKLHPTITWQDISKAKVSAFLKEAHITAGRTPVRDLLTSLTIAGPGGITNAGVLFFAKATRRFVLQCQMTLIAFKGTDRIHIFDRHDVQDDLLSQFNAAVFFLKKHLNRRSVIKGMNREDIYEIPLEALREALVNALIHRYYAVRGTSLTVEVYDDRIEITNPGGLPENLDPKSFGCVSVRRNELIADLFHRMDKGERAGTGIRRMNEAMKAASLTPPEFSFGTFCTITFKRPDFATETESGAESRQPAPRVEAQVTNLVATTPHVEPHVAPHVTPHVARLLDVLGGEMSRADIMAALVLKDRMYFTKYYLRIALEAGLIAYTIPEKPKSHLQKYRLTEKGHAVLAELNGPTAR